jgi:hypothetical protein
MEILCCIVSCGACIVHKPGGVQESCSVLQGWCKCKGAPLSADDVNIVGPWHSFWCTLGLCTVLISLQKSPLRL